MEKEMNDFQQELESVIYVGCNTLTALSNHTSSIVVSDDAFENVTYLIDAIDTISTIVEIKTIGKDFNIEVDVEDKLGVDIEDLYYTATFILVTANQTMNQYMRSERNEEHFGSYWFSIEELSEWLDLINEVELIEE